jgi:hypothetical protein
MKKLMFIGLVLLSALPIACGSNGSPNSPANTPTPVPVINTATATSTTSITITPTVTSTVTVTPTKTSTSTITSTVTNTVTSTVTMTPTSTPVLMVGLGSLSPGTVVSGGGLPGPVTVASSVVYSFPDPGCVCASNTGAYIPLLTIGSWSGYLTIGCASAYYGCSTPPTTGPYHIDAPGAATSYTEIFPK